MSYHTFNGHGSFEVFQLENEWYWWACFPGCLPDTLDEPTGPFNTADEAIENAAMGGPDN
jgi:hypothetical protein